MKKAESYRKLAPCSFGPFPRTEAKDLGWNAELSTANTLLLSPQWLAGHNSIKL